MKIYLILFTCFISSLQLKVNAQENPLVGKWYANSVNDTIYLNFLKDYTIIFYGYDSNKKESMSATAKYKLLFDANGIEVICSDINTDELSFLTPEEMVLFKKHAFRLVFGVQFMDEETIDISVNRIILEVEGTDHSVDIDSLPGVKESAGFKEGDSIFKRRE